jgi:hypothetical protein
MAPTSTYQLTVALWGLLVVLGGCSGESPTQSPAKNQLASPGKTTNLDLPYFQIEDTLESRQAIFVQGFLSGSYPEPFVISGQAVVAPLSPGTPEVFLLNGKLRADSTLSMNFTSLAQAKHDFRIVGRLVGQQLVEGQLTADSVAGRGSRDSSKALPVSLAPNESKRDGYLELIAMFLSKQMRELKEKQTLVIGIELEAPLQGDTAQLPNTKEYKLVFDVDRKKDGTAYLRGFFVADDKAGFPALQYFPLSSSLTIKSQAAADLYQLVKSSTEMLDHNLDGYFDICLLTKLVNNQETYHYFVYHPQAQLFMDWGTHINPQMDEVGGTFTSFAKLSLDNREYVQVTNRLEGGIFRPFEIQEVKISPEADSILYYLRRAPDFGQVLEKKLPLSPPN